MLLTRSVWEGGSGSSRGTILLAVILVHVLLLLALLTMRAPSWIDRSEAPTLLTFVPAPDAVRRPSTPPRPRPDGRSAPDSVAARESVDLSRSIISASDETVTLGPGGSATTGYGASGRDAGVGTGGTGVGEGSRSGAGTIPGNGPPIGITTPPAWIHRISDDELRPLLTGKLRRHGVAVSILLSCEVMLSTRVQNCHSVRETPADSGVGSVIDAASRYFRIGPARHAGLVRDAERIEILWQVDVKPVRHVQGDLPLGLQQ